MPVELHPLEQIVNVHWKLSGLAFLASLDGGMYGSEDGQTWAPLDAPDAGEDGKPKLSVPAVSLAWVKDGKGYGTWVGCGPAGCWRSEDGGASWQSCGPPYKQ